MCSYLVIERPFVSEHLTCARHYSRYIYAHTHTHTHRHMCTSLPRDIHVYIFTSETTIWSNSLLLWEKLFTGSQMLYQINCRIFMQVMFLWIRFFFKFKKLSNNLRKFLKKKTQTEKG